MQSMILGFAVAIVLAVGAHFALGTIQTSTEVRYAAPVSVRL
jgi:hypothetical protein